jgi:hypothetical protein
MGKIMTPAYRVRYRDQDGWHTTSWNTAIDGRPTNLHAECWRIGWNASFQPGAPNFHISEARGYLAHISHVEVIKQATGAIVARAAMPMFEVVA